MSENPKFNCVHLGTLEEARGAAPLVKDGKLVVIGDFVCEDRIPVGIIDCHGQDISCVGPDDPRCPNPSHAVKVSS